MEMSKLVTILSLILTTIIVTTHSQNSPPPSGKGLGISACSYNGKTDPSLGCNNTYVTVDKLPKECTALLYEIILVDMDYKLTDIYNTDENLKELLKSGTDVHILYGHYTQEEWTLVLNCNKDNGGVNAKAEMAKLKEYIDAHSGIKGIIIANLLTDGATEDLPVNENLKVYIDEMKFTFPGMEIGIALTADGLAIYSSGKPSVPLDFSVVNPSVDFYVLDFLGVVQCTDSLKFIGPVPTDGDADITLDKLLSYINKVKIPTAILHYFYGVQASSPKGRGGCELSFTTICTDPQTSSSWCADTQQTFRNKGQYAKVNGAGFIARNVDLCDPFGCCQCGFPYPAFHFLLEGYNGKTTPTPCPLFDRGSP